MHVHVCTVLYAYGYEHFSSSKGPVFVNVSYACTWTAWCAYWLVVQDTSSENLE